MRCVIKYKTKTAEGRPHTVYFRRKGGYSIEYTPDINQAYIFNSKSEAESFLPRISLSIFKKYYEIVRYREKLKIN